LSDNADLEKLKPKPDPSVVESVEAVEEAADSEGTGAEGEGEKDGL
jgi:hypothetical protein